MRRVEFADLYHFDIVWRLEFRVYTLSSSTTGMYIDIFVVQRCALQRCCRIQLYAFNEDRELLDTREYHLILYQYMSQL